MDVSQRIAAGLAHHRAGELAQAEAAYRQVLDADPTNAPIWCVLGMVQRLLGQTDEALASQQEALRLRPDFVEAHIALGNVLATREQWAEAVPHYERALRLKPDSGDAHMNLGVALRGLGQLDAALASYQQAVRFNPRHATTHANLADVLSALGRRSEALATAREALRLDPNLAVAEMNLGVALTKTGQAAEGIGHLERAIELQPGYYEARLNLGNALLAERRFAAAQAAYTEAVRLRPAAGAARSALALAQAEAGNIAEAEANFAEALRVQPDSVDTHMNLGNFYTGQLRWDEAVAEYQQALQLEPDHFDTLKNLAVTLIDQQKLAEARKVIARLLALDPEAAEAHFLLASCYLFEEDYERGWPEYEWRWQASGFGGLPDLGGIPRWAGEPLAGRQLLLVAEQGFGDTFQFIRYARPLKELGARVHFLCPPKLTSLLESQADVEWLFRFGSPLPAGAADFHLPLLSAPLALHTTAATIPREVPYLAADAQLIDRWRAELARSEGVKIGIAWQGARDFRQDRWRSIPLAQFAPLAKVPGVRLVSLQKGYGVEQLAAIDFPVSELAGLDEAAGAFMDTAAVLSSIDLLVTSDSAIAHLAGALGVPVWMATSHSPNWRWLLSGEASPWYPTMRLFRQTAPGQWRDVFERIARELAAWLERRGD